MEIYGFGGSICNAQNLSGFLLDLEGFWQMVDSVVERLFEVQVKIRWQAVQKPLETPYVSWICVDHGKEAIEE